MNWIISFFLSLPLVGLGIACGYYIGEQCVRWYRISSFEGGSGYFVLGIMLVGGIIGLIVGLVTAGFFGPQNGGAHLRAFLIGIGALLTLAAVVYVSCRFFADIPPTIDGRKLTLEVELRLPVGADSPADGQGESFMNLASVVNHVQRGSESGNLYPDQARFEEGRWIVPGDVFVFTRRGRRSLQFKLNDQDVQGFIIPLPARPDRSFLEWSDWGPRPRPPHPPWPDTQPSYRFRVQKVEPPPPAPSYEEIEAQRNLEEQQAFAAIPADAPFVDRLKYVRYGAPEDLREKSIAALTAKPTFLAELNELMRGENHELAAEALRLIEHLPDPSSELISSVESAGRDIAERIRKFNATPVEEDPSYQGAADISVRFSGWMVAARTLRERLDGDFTPELNAILLLSRERPDSYVMRQDICRVASFYMSEWAGLEPLATDPKPR